MKWRLLAAFAGLVALVLLAQDVPLAAYLRQVEHERLTAGLQRDAFVLAGTAEDVLSGDRHAGEVDTSDPAALRASVTVYAARDGARVVVVDAAGLVVAASDSRDTLGESFVNRPEIASALAGHATNGTRTSATAQGDLVYVAVPVLSGNVVGAVRITFPKSAVDHRADAKVRGLFVVGGISLVAAAIAAFFIAATIAAPLHRLRRSTERLAAGDFGERVAVEGPGETRSLARSFNTMTEQIARLVEQQRAFAGDASHQLRTPLTALRLQLERAAALVDDDPDAARQRLEAAGEETERLTRMVEGLLLIAHSEPGARVRIDVQAVVRDRAEVWGPFAAERGISVVTRGDAPLPVDVVADAVEQIVDNLVDNALAVSPAGSTVTLTTARDGPNAVLHVIDAGPGMPEAFLSRAFDRFWRAPDAPHGGSGIGLAVVRHLTEQCGGNVELRNRGDGHGHGLDALVCLPLVVSPRAG